MQRAQISLASYAGQRLEAESTIFGGIQKAIESGSVFVVLVSVLVFIDLFFNTLIIGTAFLFSCSVLLFSIWAYHQAVAAEKQFVNEKLIKQ